MKKERKQGVGLRKQKRLRKQSFRRIFIRYFLGISICMSVLFCIAAYLGMELYAKQYQMERNETLQRFYNSFSELAGNPESAFDSAKWIIDDLGDHMIREDVLDPEKWMTDLGVHMIQEQNLVKITSFLYRMDDGTEIAATTNRPYMIAQTYGEEGSSCYIAGMDYSELIRMIETNQEKCQYEEGLSSDVEVQGIRVKEGKFYFGNVLLTLSKNGKIVSTRKYDGTPVWGFTEHYPYLSAIDMHLEGPYYADARILEKNRNYLEQHYDVSKKILSGELEDYESIVDAHLFKDSYVITCSPMNHMQYMGTELCMVNVYHYNLWQRCGLVVKGAAVITFLLILLSAFFFSYRHYMLQKLQWEMLFYRKNITNIMAHDLRTPLTAISGYAENIVNDSNPEKNENYLQNIVDNVQYMNELIQHVLLLSEELDSRQPHIEQVELADITEELIRYYAGPAEEKNISIHQSGECQLSVNATCFHSVLKNLIGNAIEHGKEGDVVSISMDQGSYTIVNAIQPENKSENRMKGMGMSIVKEVLGYYGYQMQVSQKDNSFIVRLLF